ncbi:hypothetical protein R6Q59_031227 [Mikania micrantha]
MEVSSLAPGFRFHPTDVELVVYYLKNKLLGKKIISNVVTEVNIYDFCPWDLPDKSSLKSGDLEWYFFCPKAKKYSSGARSNRATETGFWKATGKDRMVHHKERIVATIKTLVFHLGHAGKGQRTNWVMHEYRMEDEQLASAGVVQDAYVLCRIFEKSGIGPKNGARYGKPFDEDAWDDDLASCSDSLAIVGAPNTKDCKRKGPAITDVTEPGSSFVTTLTIEPKDTLNYKKGPATNNLTGPGSSVVTSSTNEPTNILNYKQKGPVTSTITEPGSSVVTFSANEPTDTLNFKQKGPTTMNITVPQTTHGLSVTEPGSSSVMLSNNETPVNDDVMFLEDIDLIMGAADEENAKTIASNEDDGFYNELKSLINLDDLKTDGAAEYTLDELLEVPELGWFYVD